MGITKPFYLFRVANFQILRDWQLQGGRDRRLQAQGGHARGGGRHLQVQEGQPDHVCLGDKGQTAGGGGLQPRQRAQCQLNQ